MKLREMTDKEASELMPSEALLNLCEVLAAISAHALGVGGQLLGKGNGRHYNVKEELENMETAARAAQKVYQNIMTL